MKTSIKVIIKPNDAYRWVIREHDDLDDVTVLEYQETNSNGAWLTLNETNWASLKEITAVSDALKLVHTMMTKED